MTLNQLINDKGKPKILIDHWDTKKKGYACFDFNETIIWDDRGLFFNGTHIKNPNLNDLQDALDSWKTDNSEICAIGFINYNFKNILYPHIQFKKKCKNNFPYVYFVKPEKLFTYDINEELSQPKINLDLVEDILNISDYEKIIHYIKNKLKNGDVYQINFTMQKKIKINNNPIDIYLSMRQKAKPKFGYYLDLEDLTVLSFSPEQFFEINNNNIYSYPMKGTRPRSNDKNKDLILKDELRKSEKDKAEHLMIVDLLRNDIGKISKYGTVNVKDLFNVESFETVHQMVTEVSGVLKNNINETNVIKALFPGGSITGAPKESAMKIIDKIENYERNIYTGAIGYICSNGNMNFNMPIRTMTIKDDQGTYPVGGGIVWDSVTIEEWEEAQLKSKILNITSKKECEV